MKTTAIMNRANRAGCWQGGLLALVALSACVPTTPRLDAGFGGAVGMARAAQTINPDASRNTDAVMGINGQAGDAIVDNFRDSFRNPPGAMRSVINVGTTGAGASSGGDN